MLERVIYKYNLFGWQEEEVSIDMPGHAKIIMVGLDPTGRLCLWAELHPTINDQCKRTFRVYGTGFPIFGGEWEYIGSVMDSVFVWHIGEIK